MTSFFVVCIWHEMVWRVMGGYIKRDRNARGKNDELKCKEVCGMCERWKVLKHWTKGYKEYLFLN